MLTSACGWTPRDRLAARTVRDSVVPQMQSACGAAEARTGRPPQAKTTAMTKYFVLACCLLFAGVTQAQDVDDYAARTLRNGLPSFPPLTRQPIEDPLSAVLPVPDPGHTVTVIWGSRDGDPFPWLLHQRPDDTVTIAGLRAEPIGDGMFEARTELIFQPGLGGSTPLSLLVLPEDHILLYRWPGPSSFPGGEPTMVPKSMDAGTDYPDLHLQTLAGANFDIDQFWGEFKFVAYWDPSCSAFLEDVAALDSLAGAYDARSDVEFIAISVDAAVADEFLARHSFSFEHAVATDEAIKVLGTSFPRYTIVSPEGRVLYDATGGGAGTAIRIGQMLEGFLP